ncbi:MAG: gamma-glutamylcyclotransferase [Aestuariivirga sp.]
MMASVQQRWVFGYGSLMWRPGFAYQEAVPALIHGFHRALCVYSWVHRGTPERPGLVLGLDRGGACLGIAFKIDPGKWDETLSYLREREQVTMVYREIEAKVRLQRSGDAVPAVTYAVDRAHRQYAGKLPAEKLVEIVADCEGKSGRNDDYVFNTLAHLRQMQITDPVLEEVAAKLRAQAASLPA